MKLAGGVVMTSWKMSLTTWLLSDQVEVSADVIISVAKLQKLLFSVGELVLLKLLRLLELLELLELVLVELPSLQDLQHIWRYPAMEQYRLNTSLRQNIERSPRHRCLEEIFGAGKLGLDLDSHCMMAFFLSPLQGGARHARAVIGRGSLQFPAEPSGLEQAT